KVQAVVQICVDSCDSECRDWHSFGCTCGAGSVALDKYAFRSDFSAGLQRLIGIDQLIDILSSVKHRNVNIGELGLLVLVSNYKSCLCAVDPHRDRYACKGSK